ncbi:MAG: hypothetical protein KZQ58_00120, partial [gamma proteobacterium symbiont of Bathyaustriella thionipta]|nr:hypothetical protein [gamma proteobacterium symbiont of Bathyaustriella thionipta]
MSNQIGRYNTRIMKTTYFMILLLMAAIAAGWWLSGQQSAGSRSLLWQGRMDTQCQLDKQSCSLQAPQGRIRMQIVPRPIAVMQPLQIKIETDIGKIKNIRVEISGLNMDMGTLPFLLSRQSGQTYQGKAMLPVCSNQRMHWQARVYMETAEGLLLA